MTPGKTKILKKFARDKGLRIIDIGLKPENLQRAKYIKEKGLSLIGLGFLYDRIWLDAPIEVLIAMHRLWKEREKEWLTS